MDSSALPAVATGPSRKKLAAEGLEGGSFAEKIDGYQKMAEEYNAAIQETAEAKGA
jgi:hypothetical protein